CTHVDVDVRALDAGIAARIVALLESGADEHVLACRGTHLFRPDVQPIALPPAARVARLRERGVYLVTGGLGGVGSTLAEHLAREVRARLVLVGRTPGPSRADWVRRLEALGGEVLVEAADVCDAVAMARVLRSAAERFGPIQGVIHAAGLPDTAGVI